MWARGAELPVIDYRNENKVVTLLDLGGVAAVGVGGQHAVREVLQHDRVPADRGDLPDDLVGGGSLHRQLGEDLVQLLRGAQLGELLLDDPGVHGLGDVDERRLVRQHDHGEAEVLGGGDLVLPVSRRRAGVDVGEDEALPHPQEIGDIAAPVLLTRGDHGHIMACRSAPRPGAADGTAAVSARAALR